MRGPQAAGATHTLSRRATEEKGDRGCGGSRRPETLGLAMSDADMEGRDRRPKERPLGLMMGPRGLW